jgi:ATP-dependent Lon protease
LLRKLVPTPAKPAKWSLKRKWFGQKPDDQDEPSRADASKVEDAPEEGNGSEQGSETGNDGTLPVDDHKTVPVAPPTIPVVSVKAIERLLARLESAERKDDAREQLGKRFKAMLAREPRRKLATLAPTWLLLLDELSERFPNFHAVIEFVRTECIIASMTSQHVVRLPPMMLAGEPGVGKTAFAKDLATFLGGGFYNVAMENAQTGAGLSGSAQYWANSRTGKVFNALIDDDFANPVFLVDELDKATGHSGYDPLAPLYQFLERHQAAVFHDESIPDLSIDASHITLLLTANDLTKVPEPILSRLQIFDIPAPDAVQARSILKRIFTETVAAIVEAGMREDHAETMANLTISQHALDILSSLPLRQAKIQLRPALARALQRRALLLEPCDLTDLSTMAVTGTRH